MESPPKGPPISSAEVRALQMALVVLPLYRQWERAGRPRKEEKEEKGCERQ